jgi:enoyl-CoA hydratase/carnithine racemase
MDMILTGRSVDAQTALQIGLVTRVVPTEGLMDEAMAVVAAIAKLDRFAVSVAKAATLRSVRRELDADIEEERRLFALCLVAKNSVQ